MATDLPSPMTTFQAPMNGTKASVSNASEVFSQLRGRLNSANQAVHETLTEMMGLMELQLRELQSLRDQLAQAEQNQQVSVPQVAALLPTHIQAPRPISSPVPPTSAPMTFHSIPVPEQRQFTQPMASAVPKRLPSGPMMTQILWPSKPGTITEPTAAASAQPSAAGATIKPMSHFEAALAAPTRKTAPSLEQATLEELNAALAYAFAQVSSSGVPVGKESAINMMPSPMPTSALRYGQRPEYTDAR
jgi:predicted amino acid-binding ACT domain protein